jgi:hypothetical protein
MPRNKASKGVVRGNGFTMSDQLTEIAEKITRMNITGDELAEEGEILGEIGELIPADKTVGEVFLQWEKTNPKKHHRLATLIARLALRRSVILS